MHRSTILAATEELDDVRADTARILLSVGAAAGQPGAWGDPSVLVQPAELEVVGRPPADQDGVWWAEAAGDDLSRSDGFVRPLASAMESTAGEIDAIQILRDRPDVFAEYFRAFFGPGNDRNSPAWLERVGGYGPEAYARYWYEAHGRAEGYTPNSVGQGAPAQPSSDESVGRTTFDGIPLARILQDRPDVFRAFFTEYYGPNNDRNSDAWLQRVGGTTVEDYANYWYNAHGRAEGYAPVRPSPQDAEHVGSPAPGAPAPEGPPAKVEDPSLDPWNHPAIFPDWSPPYDGWVAPDGSVWARPAPGLVAPVDPDGLDTPTLVLARPLVIQVRDDGFELVPATDEEIASARTLFDDPVF